MQKQNIVCCYYPTTVVFVDDNKSFLDNILLGLDEHINTISFTEPTKAISYLKQHELASFTKKYLNPVKNNESLEELDSENVEHSYVDINIFDIHKEILKPNRFNTVIVVVVDYTMPEMNGLELCKILKESPFKFVLITGDATLDNTIEAFNAGLIHHFIPKNASEFTQKLQNSIYGLQKKQFEDCSEIIIKNLNAIQPSNLSDPTLVNFLNSFFKNNNIDEYYLINKSGCFLTTNAQGKLGWLIVKSEAEIEEYTNIAKDHYGKEELINALQNRTKILFLYNEEDHIKTTVDQWESYLYPATKLIGEYSTYYYSFVTDSLYNNIFADKIVTYQNFLMDAGVKS